MIVEISSMESRSVEISSMESRSVEITVTAGIAPVLVDFLVDELGNYIVDELGNRILV